MPNRQLMEDRLRFLNIDQNTINELRNIKDIIEPSIDSLLDNFYTHLLKEPDLQPLISDDDEIQKARAAQRNHWLEALFSGKYDSDYFEKTQHIGLAHARIGLTPNWYIGGYNLMFSQFIELITEHYAKTEKSATASIQAVSKIVFLDMDMVIHCYLDAKDEAIRRMLVSSTELRAEMWKFSDELSEVSAAIDTTASNLSEVLPSGSKQDEIHRQAQLLLKQAEELKDEASRLNAHLKSLPMTEKLYLPEASLFSRLKDKLFGQHYYRGKAR